MCNWADLPEDLLRVILSSLFAKIDRHSFSRVCRSWNNAVTSNSPFHNSPGLIFYQPINRLSKFFQYNGFYSKKHPQLRGTYIRCAKYGWLLLSGDDSVLFFFNPFKEITKIRYLPKSDYHYSSIAFFNKPTSPNCVLIGVMNMNPEQVRIGVLKNGDDEWKSYSYHFEAGYQLSLCNPILHGGLLYCLDKLGNLSSFNTNELGNQSSWIVKATDTSLFEENGLYTQIKHQYLIKLDGEQVLLAVIVAYDVRKVNVYRLDMIKWPECEEWEPVEDLGDKALFVSYSASFGVTVPPPPLEWTANKIFFPKLHDGRSIVFYSLDTKKYYAYDGDYSRDNSYGFSNFNLAAWIVPEPNPRYPREVKWHPNGSS